MLSKISDYNDKMILQSEIINKTFIEILFFLKQCLNTYDSYSLNSSINNPKIINKGPEDLLKNNEMLYLLNEKYRKRIEIFLKEMNKKIQDFKEFFLKMKNLYLIIEEALVKYF